MSVLVVIEVAIVVFLYVRATRQARRAWLQKLDLPGQWLCDIAEEEVDDPAADISKLTLRGGLDQGEFVLLGSRGQVSGRWQLDGHHLKLTGEQLNYSYDLHMFKPGSIGLEHSEGRRVLLQKVVNNVVPLRGRE